MAGRLFGLGVGPGDPELITLKALRRLGEADVVAYFAARGRKGNALTTVASHLPPSKILLPLIYPVTTEKKPAPFCYETAMRDFYDESAQAVAAHLAAGRDVAVICEGDPLFFGSFMYLHDRLAEQYPTEVVPGVCSMLACAAVAGVPLVYRNQSLTVLSGVLPEEELRRRLASTEAAVVMKLGTNFAKVRQVITDLGLLDRARYVERATMAEQRTVPLDGIDPTTVPYFAMILVPGARWEA